MPPLSARRVLMTVSKAGVDSHRDSCHHITLDTSDIMQFLSWFSVLALALAASAQDRPEVTELQIETTYKPEDCPVTAKTGDAIKVHYVSNT